jgi:serine/threonine protein kinase
MPDWALVMERGYPVSSLFDNDRDLLPDLLWLQIIQMIGRALFAALAHLHACGLVHRDVRLDHVLSRQPCSALLAALQTGHVPGPGEFFLCDFSLMRPCTADGASDGADSPTLPYAPVRAPEIFLGDTRRLPSGDIWAAGCVLLEMLLRQAGEPVFDCGYGCSASELRSLTAIFELLGSPGVTLATETNLESEQPRVQIPNDQESSLSKRIAQCWNSDQVRGVLEQAVDLVRHLLDYCGERRLTAAEALEHPFLRDTIR